jgi:alpha-glucosidase
LEKLFFMRDCLKNILFLALLLGGLSSADEVQGEGFTIFAAASPDRTTRLEVCTRQRGELSYRVSYMGKPVTDWSPLGLIINGVKTGEHVMIQGETQNNHLDKFAWPLGESDTIINEYREMSLSCRSGPFTFRLVTRVFNGSIAFRYIFPEQRGFETGLIREEKTSFHFTTPYRIYQYHGESVFTPSGIDSITTSCDLPATLTNGQYYLSIGEAENDNYTKAELGRGDVPHSLRMVFARDSVVRTSGAFQTPWRTMSISRTAIGLHAFSNLYLRLNPPAAGGVPSWIRPGKLIRAQLTTQSGLDCIDFAARHNFQYIMFDAGWYGAEFRTSSDPATVIPAIDMPAVIHQAKEKGIGVILYVNYAGLRKELDNLLPLYKKWGVSGLKFGFVDGFTQDGLVWLASAIKKVNDYGFILDIHDNYKPTGLSRTYPALLTQEGIRGDENSPDAFHTTVLPFTRFLAGPADFTICYPNATNSYSKNIRVSKAQQLALTVIYFSPLQSMLWYGKPTDYTDEQDIEFFKYVPTVWNESLYLAGEIGKKISVARRHGSTWFMGNAAGLEDWKDTIRLDFLTKGKSYMATIYEDDGNGGIRKRTLEVRKGFMLPVDLKAKAGQAIILSPVG